MNSNINSITQYQQIIERYVKGKDQNRPHLLSAVFAEDAVLEMKVDSENISFPSQTTGCAAIADVLVSQFSAKFENVYTFCLTDQLTLKGDQLICEWYVFMKDKADGSLRIGKGFYQWHFTENTAPVSYLKISIEKMQIFETTSSRSLFAQVDKLSKCWVSFNELAESLQAQQSFIAFND